MTETGSVAERGRQRVRMVLVGAGKKAEERTRQTQKDKERRRKARGGGRQKEGMAIKSTWLKCIHMCSLQLLLLLLLP